MNKIAIKRSLPPLVLDRSPLVYFVAQLRFSPILAMEQHVNDIQERFRMLGYPFFSRHLTHSVSVGVSNAAPLVEGVTLWNFTSNNRKTGVVLSNNFVSFQAVEYSRYDDVLPKIIEVISAIDSVVHLNITERIGLRYLDIVYPRRDAGEMFATYLQPELVGLSGKAIGVESLFHSAVFVGQTELNGTLVVRFNTSEAPRVLPPDLAGPNLEIPPLSAPNGERIGVLDFDHFIDPNEPFDVHRVHETFAVLHDAIARAFDACTTTKARELWGKRNVE